MALWGIEQAAASVPVRVTVVAGQAAELPGKTGQFDPVVASLVLCSVGDVPGALTEITRDAITPLWSRAAGGCHPNRDTEPAIPLPASPSPTSTGSASPPPRSSRRPCTSLGLPYGRDDRVARCGHPALGRL